MAINKNRRAPHIVQIVPFNLISSRAVDSEKRTISRWAVCYPASRVRLSGVQQPPGADRHTASRERTTTVCWSSQWDKTRRGMMSSNDMSGFCFVFLTPSPGNQTSRMSHSRLHPSLSSIQHTVRITQACRWCITNYFCLQFSRGSREQEVGANVKCI